MIVNHLIILIALMIASAVSAASASSAAPPAMPRIFDRDTVKGLIDSIEKPRQATILKIGYFARRGSPALSTIDGFAMLDEAIDREPTASRRWFILEEVRAFAAFRAKDVPHEEGFNAYDDLLGQASKAKAANADYSLHQAIQELVISAASRLGSLHLESDPRVQEILLKAWTVYTTDFPQDQTVPEELPWAEAIKKIGLEEPFIPLLEKTLQDPAVPKTYGLLKLAAGVYRAKTPAKSILLLEQAKPLLPLKDTVEVGRFYDMLVDLLEEASKQDSARLTEAIAAQQERIKLTGSGQAHLAILYLRNQDEKSFQSIFQDLSAPEANEREINDLAGSLRDLGEGKNASGKTGNPQAEEEAISLLSKYLAASRTRNVEQELEARKTLGILLIHQGKWNDTRVVLQVEHLKPPFSTLVAQRRYEEIQRMLRSLDARTEGSH